MQGAHMFILLPLQAHLPQVILKLISQKALFFLLLVQGCHLHCDVSVGPGRLLRAALQGATQPAKEAVCRDTERGPQGPARLLDIVGQDIVHPSYAVLEADAWLVWMATLL